MVEVVLMKRTMMLRRRTLEGDEAEKQVALAGLVMIVRLTCAISRPDDSCQQVCRSGWIRLFQGDIEANKNGCVSTPS